MSSQELVPGLALRPLGRRFDPVFAQDVGNRLRGDRVTQMLKRSLDLAISPMAVLKGEPHDQSADDCR